MSKSDPTVKLGAKVTPKRGYPVPKMFTPFLESLPKNYCMIGSPTLNRRTDMS